MAEKFDFTKYPEGFDRMCELCDHMPDDKNARAAFVEGMMGFVLTL